jgi:hypothetical protein
MVSARVNTPGIPKSYLSDVLPRLPQAPNLVQATQLIANARQLDHGVLPLADKAQAAHKPVDSYLVELKS